VIGLIHCDRCPQQQSPNTARSNRVLDYDQNRTTSWLLAARLEENGQFENVYTIGMRGIHDSGMPGGGNTRQKSPGFGG